jgi:hypothetical protein
MAAFPRGVAQAKAVVAMRQCSSDVGETGASGAPPTGSHADGASDLLRRVEVALAPDTRQFPVQQIVRQRVGGRRAGRL